MDFQRLKDLMDHFTSWRIPGCSCVVYYKHRPVFKYSSGFADVENGIKMDADYHRMFMYSCSKPVTCTAAMMLWEQGKFLLDDPVEKFLPGWGHVKYTKRLDDGSCEAVDFDGKVSVANLFEMTSGLDYNVSGAAFTAARKKFAPECNTVDMMNALAGDPLYEKPGQYWFYGMSHDVLAAVIEVVSGMSLRGFAKKNIFEPLGMNDTVYSDGEIGERAAVQYWFNNEADRYQRADQHNGYIFGKDYASGGAGIVSTVPDMAKFTEMLTNGGKTPDGEIIISRRTIDLMRKNRLRESMRQHFWYPGYGYGLGVRTLIDPAAAGATSALGEFGWSGAAGAYMIADPNSEVALFYAHHMLNNQEPYTTPRLRNVLYSCLD